MANPSGSVAATIVNDKYNKSVALAEAASSQIAGLQAALTNSLYAPPTINVHWQTLAAPDLPPIPDIPALPEAELLLPDGMPSAFTGAVGNVVFDDFTATAPTLNFPVKPSLHVGSAPPIAEVRDVAIPDDPSVVLPDAPTFLAVQTHTFGGVNLHEDWLAKLENIPELSLVEPTPFSYVPGQRYGSQLLESLKATLNARIHGGTGLAPEVEQQIWDRARDRETQLALGREQEVQRAAEALGFPLPSGVMAGQLADARREYLDKLSGLSRDIAIKQAELEQENVKISIDAALRLESTLLEDCYKLEMLAFEAAKTAAEMSIAGVNAKLEQFKALLLGYQAYASAYDTLIKAELSKIEVFKALLQAESIKADINKSLVERYKAEIDGRMAVVEIYKARVGAAQTLVELERTRIQASGEQVKAFVATVNAETAKAEMYKTEIEAEGAKQGVYDSMVRAYGAKTSAQAEQARSNVAVFQARIQAKGLEWDGWKAKLQAAVSVAELKARTASIVVDGYRLGASAAEAQATSYMRRWEADIKQYEASRSIAYNVAKYNADAVIHASDVKVDAAKIGLATGVQQVASAWAMVSAQAQVADNTTLSIKG